jgi:hypothetical protein
MLWLEILSSPAEEQDAIFEHVGGSQNRQRTLLDTWRQNFVWSRFCIRSSCSINHSELVKAEWLEGVSFTGAIRCPLFVLASFVAAYSRE